LGHVAVAADKALHEVRQSCNQSAAAIAGIKSRSEVGVVQGRSCACVLWHVCLCVPAPVII